MLTMPTNVNKCQQMPTNVNKCQQMPTNANNANNINNVNNVKLQKCQECKASASLGLVFTKVNVIFNLFNSLVYSNFLCGQKV